MIKKITLTIIAVFAIIFITQTSYAVSYDDIDEIIIPTITPISHGINGLGDIELSPSITQVRNDLDTQAYQGRVLYVVTPKMTITFQYNIDNITYTYNEVSRYEIIYDWYVSTSNRRYEINLYNSVNALIHTRTIGIGVITFLPQTYVIDTQTYEMGYSKGYNEAQNKYGILYNNQWYNALEWGNIRFTQGVSANPDENALALIFNGISQVFGTALAFILTLGSIELLGISLNMILGIGLLIIGVITILALIFGR